MSLVKVKEVLKFGWYSEILLSITKETIVKAAKNPSTRRKISCHQKRSWIGPATVAYPS